jgi:hypothetical protein
MTAAIIAVAYLVVGMLLALVCWLHAERSGYVYRAPPRSVFTFIILLWPPIIFMVAIDLIKELRK